MGNTYNRIYIWCCKYGENRYCEWCANKKWCASKHTGLLNSCLGKLGLHPYLVVPLISARVTLISTRVSAHCQAILLQVINKQVCWGQGIRFRDTFRSSHLVVSCERVYWVCCDSMLHWRSGNQKRDTWHGNIFLITGPLWWESTYHQGESTTLCGGKPPITDGFPSQRAGDASLRVEKNVTSKTNSVRLYIAACTIVVWQSICGSSARSSILALWRYLTAH